MPNAKKDDKLSVSQCHVVNGMSGLTIRDGYLFLSQFEWEIVSSQNYFRTSVSNRTTHATLHDLWMSSSKNPFDWIA